MSKTNNLDKMSFAELAAMEREIDRLKMQKRSANGLKFAPSLLQWRSKAALRLASCLAKAAAVRALWRSSTAIQKRCQHMDRSWSYAAVDGSGREGQQGEEGRFSDLTSRRPPCRDKAVGSLLDFQP